MFRCAVVLCLIMLCAAHAFAENPFGRALVLNGEGQYFEVPDSACADIASLYTFTLEIRYKLDGHQGFNLFNKWRYYKPTTSKRHPRSRFRGHGWMIEVNRSSSDIMGKLELSYLNPLDAFLANDYVRITRAHADPSGGSGYGRSGSGGRGITHGEWQHFTLIINGGDRRFYVNGVSNGSGHSSNGVNPATGYPLNVGGFPDSVDATLDLSAYLVGQIDEFRIWNVVRTSNEINTFMNDTLSADIYTSAESGLIGYYRFEELENLGIGNDGLANDVRDLSVNDNHGNVWNGGSLSDQPVQTKGAEPFEIPVTYQLYQNSPISYNSSAKINLDLPKASPVEIVVSDIRGQIVATLTDDLMEAGSHSFDWASPLLPSGVYLGRIKSNGFQKTIKMVLQN